MLYTEFQSSTMPGTGQKVCCGGGWWWWLRPIIVLSLAQAEQFLDSVMKKSFFRQTFSSV